MDTEGGLRSLVTAVGRACNHLGQAELYRLSLSVVMLSIFWQRACRMVFSIELTSFAVPRHRVPSKRAR